MSFRSGKAVSTRKALAFSYCIVLLLPLLFGVMLDGFAIHLVRKESMQLHETFLSSLEDSVNISLTSMNSVINTLTTNYEVNRLAKQDDFSTGDYWKMHEIQDKLRFARLSNNDIDDILIYFHRSDTLLGSQSYFRNVTRTQGDLEILCMNTAEFQDHLQQENTLRFFFASSPFQKPFLIRSNASATASGEPTVTFLIRLSKETMLRTLRSENAITFLFDENKRFISSDTVASISSDDLIAAADEQKPLGPYSVIDHPASMLGLRYIRLMPLRIYVRDVFRMTRILLGYILICLLLGIPLAKYMFRRSYNPIQQIISILPQLSTQQDEDDFSRIEQSLRDLIRRNKRNESILDRQAENVKSHLMHKLIRLGDEYAREFSERCADLGVQLPYRSFLLIAVDVEDGSSLFFENKESVNHEMARLAFLAVSDILADLLRDIPFFIAEYNGLLLTLVNVDDRLDKQHVLSEVRRCGHELFSRMQNDFRVRISLSISDIHEGYDGVGRCYQEIQEIVYRRDSEKTEPMLFYRDLGIDEEQARLEKEAILAIRSHAYDQARELVRQAGRFLSAQDEQEEPALAAVESKKPIQEILAYIDANYADPNLSISAIAAQFGMSPSYFSLYFKRKMDFSPLDYVNTKRIEQVKCLLATDLPIKTIAHEVGYFDTRPMIRFFKRSEGITPTEYREKLRAAD